MRAVEEAFETLRSAGLSPDARSAFGAILDHVMNEFDAPQARWAERAKYRFLIERLASEQPLVPRDDSRAPVPEVSDRNHTDAGAQTMPGAERTTAHRAVHCVGQHGEQETENEFPHEAGVSLSIPEIEAFVEKGVESAVRRAMARPGSQDFLSSRVPAFIDKKRGELGEKNKHVADYPGRIDIFIAIIGDKPIGAYTPEDMHRFRDIVDQIPVKAKQRFRTADPLMQIQMNSELAIPLPPIDPGSVDSKYLSPLKTLFSHFETIGLIERNPLKGVASNRIKGEDGITIDASEIRLPLEPDHVAALRAMADKKPRNSPDYWWIRVLPRTGLRLDEFAVLSPIDIRQINGRWCIDLLHMENGDTAHRDRRRELDLKTQNSRRIVPIHPALIEDGFLEFVERRRKRGGERVQLFPHCRPDKHGCHSAPLSKRLNLQIRKVSSDKRHVVHSTRHGFAAACDAAGVPAVLREKFLGHAPSDEKSNGGVQRSRDKLQRRYGSPILSPEEMEWMNHVQV